MYCLGKKGTVVSDNNKGLILLSVIQSSRGHCMCICVATNAERSVARF